MSISAWRSVDVAAGAARAIAQIRRNHQRALAADMHGGEAFVPALDDLALADVKETAGHG